MKKILYITPGLPVGGAEKFLVSLSSAFCQYTEKQTIVSLSNNNPLEHEFDSSINIIKLPRKNKWSIKEMLEFRKYIRKERPDIVFCINFFSYIFAKLAMMGLSSNEKIVISYHSTIHLTQKEHFLHKLYFKTLKKNYQIITVCRNQADYTSTAYKVPASYFKTIYNGVDTGWWKLQDNKTERELIRHKFNIPLSAKVIILTAGFRAEKNHKGALRALTILHKKYQCPAYLLFVGNGPLFDEISELAENSPVAQYVKFAGLQKDVRPYYWSADLFTLCSTSVETFSIAALEAMSCGLPAVLTDIGGANEMVTDGETGFICLPSDSDIAEKWHLALIHSFSNYHLHNHIVSKFSIEKMIREYKNLLDIDSDKMVSSTGMEHSDK